MRNSMNLSTYQAEYDKLVRKLRSRHPSHFDEYKSYQKEMFPDDTRTKKELTRDYYKMAFKVEIRQNPKFSNLSYEDIDEVYSNLSHFEEKNN